MNVSQMAFNLAYWMFASNYYTLSWRLQLISQNESPDLFNSRFKILNASVIFIAVLFPVLGWSCWQHNALFDVFTTMGIIPLFISSFVLFSGIRRMTKSASLQNQMVDKKKVTEHMISYIFMILISLIQCIGDSIIFLLDNKNQISYIDAITITVLVINMVSELILIQIMNGIITKVVEILASRNFEDDLDSMDPRFSYLSNDNG